MTEEITILAIQTDIIWQNRDANIQKIEQIIANQDNINILILPEMFTTGYQPVNDGQAETMNGTTVKWMQQIAVNRNIIVTGSIKIAEHGRLYNRSIWAMPDGTIEHYNKRHLFTYGNEHINYTPGNKRVIIQYNNWRFLPQICYDLRFPVWSRNQNDYDIAVYVASWSVPRTWVWEQLLVTRAIENQCFVIGVNRVGTDGYGHKYEGRSKIVSPSGKIIAQSDNDTEQTIKATISRGELLKIRDEFPALYDRDEFIIKC